MRQTRSSSSTKDFGTRCCHQDLSRFSVGLLSGRRYAEHRTNSTSCDSGLARTICWTALSVASEDRTRALPGWTHSPPNTLPTHLDIRVHYCTSGHHLHLRRSVWRGISCGGAGEGHGGGVILRESRIYRPIYIESSLY